MAYTHRSLNKALTAPSRTARGYVVQPGWRLLIQDLGISPEAVLRRAQLPADLLIRSSGSLTAAEYFALWDAIEAEAQSCLRPGPPVPLRIAQALSAEWFDPVLFSALCSDDLISALGRIAKYKRLICPMQMEVESNPRHTSLTMRWPENGAKPPPVLLAFELVFFVQLARMATRSHLSPISVVSPVLPEPGSAYEAFFGVPIKRGAAMRLVFSTQDARRPFLTVNPALWSFFEPALRQRLSELEADASVTERLRSALLEALPAGEASMQGLCRKLGMSSRTLQRRLSEEGTSFQATLDAVRTELARHYLTQSSMSGAEIAFLLGFEDPNSFFRAFHRWTGTTPSGLRPA
jgi:AraC-like DNA-binding protein